MAAPNITTIMEALEGSISGEIYTRGYNTSPWLDLPKQESWPEGQGYTLQALTLGRSLPSNPLSWQTVVPSAGGAGGICIPPKQRLTMTRDLVEFNLQETALESEDLCVTDLMNSYRAEEQLAHLVETLAENTRQAWIYRNRSEYCRLAAHKCIATLGGLVEDDEWATTLPTSVMTGGFLLQLYTRLLRLGAGRKSYGNLDGQPTFVALTGPETTERLMQEETYRASLRESNRVPELLAPLGVSRNYRGFWLLGEVTPPRHNLTNGAWVEVPFYKWIDGELTENPDYETAQTEDTVIYHEDVYRSLVRPPDKSYGSAKFDPNTYRGDWRWKMILNRDDNPDGKYGFYRGLFGTGSKPKTPAFGFVVRHLRCGIASGAMACDES